MAKAMEADQGRVYGRVEQMVANASKAIENSINTTIVGQLRDLEAKQATLAEKVGEVVLQSKNDNLRSASTHEMLQEHMELMERLNEKCDAQATALAEHGKMLDEKLSHFERGVIAELKAATEHMDLKAHEESFAKLERDVTAFYAELGEVRTDFATQ